MLYLEQLVWIFKEEGFHPEYNVHIVYHSYTNVNQHLKYCEQQNNNQNNV